MILIDCAPNFNMVTRTAIVASDHLLIPAKADYLSTLGIDYLRRKLAELIRDYNAVAGDRRHQPGRPRGRVHDDPDCRRGAHHRGT